MRYLVLFSALIILLLPAQGAGAAPLRALPTKQTIFLGQAAVIKIKSKSRCRLVSGINKKRVSAKYRRGLNRFTVRPTKTGQFLLRFRCANNRSRSLVNVISDDRGNGDINNGGGQDNGLDPDLPGPNDPGNQPRSASRLGTNAAAVTYYDGVVPFSDLMMQAGDWLDSFTARADGYPASLPDGSQARVALAEAVYPAGVYNVSWQGQGSFTIAGQTFSGSNGSGQVSLDGSSLVLLTISQTEASDPVHDIKVVAPGESGFFRSKYLAQLAPYGIIRFMDWQRTNGTFSDPAPSLSCSNRTLDNSYSQGTRRGASIEAMVALANKTGAAPWFTIPHKADDSFIRCLAGVVKNNLRDDLTPRFEFSNETWNPTFEQYSDIEAAGSSLGGGDAYLGLQRAHARRHKQVMTILAEEITARPFIRVLAGQAANSWVLEQRLDFENTAASVDEIAIAPYVGEHDAFDPGEANRVAGLTMAQLFTELNGKLTSEVSPWISSHVGLANSYNKRLIAYEGGQHLAGDQSNNTLTDLFTSANRDSRMGSLYDNYFALWDSLTGQASFVHFTDVGPYTRFGSWGALETPDQNLSGSAKYQALLRQAAKE